MLLFNCLIDQSLLVLWWGSLDILLSCSLTPRTVVRSLASFGRSPWSYHPWSWALCQLLERFPWRCSIFLPYFSSLRHFCACLSFWPSMFQFWYNCYCSLRVWAGGPLVTWSSPRCPLWSNSLVHSKNNSYFVIIGPIRYVDLTCIFDLFFPLYVVSKIGISNIRYF